MSKRALEELEKKGIKGPLMTFGPEPEPASEPEPKRVPRRLRKAARKLSMKKEPFWNE